MLDEKDIKIINFLLEDGRMSYSRIAKEIGLTEAAIRKRIKKLEETGVIKGYQVKVDTKKLGYEAVSIVGINTEPEDILKVARQLAEKPWTKNVILVTGDHMILAEVWAKNNEELNRYIDEIYKMGKVTNVRPSIILEYIKG